MSNFLSSRLRRNRLAWLLPLLMLLGSTGAWAQVSVTATSGTTGPTSYATLTAAFSAINAGTHKGAITIGISANTTETAPLLQATGNGSSNYTSILIQPTADGVTVTSAVVNGTIELVGASNVTIDGDNPNTTGTNRNLTIASTVTANASAVVRIAGITTGATVTATNDIIRNCVITGANTGNANAYGIYAGLDATAYATLPAITVAGAGKYASLTISNNLVQTTSRAISVTAASASAATGINITNNTLGSATASNLTSLGVILVYATSPTVSGNTIRSITTAQTNIGAGSGVYLGNCSSPTVSGNTISAINSSAAALTTDIFCPAGIAVAAGTTTPTISGNIITGVQNTNSSGYSVVGIKVTNSSPCTIYNNAISALNAVFFSLNYGYQNSYAVFGIFLASGTGHKVYYNSIYLQGTPLSSSSGSAEHTACLAIGSTSVTGLDIRNNIFANFFGATAAINTCLSIPSGLTSSASITINNNAYYAPTTTGNYIAQRYTPGTSTDATYTAANFSATATTPTTNLRNYTSTLSTAGTNDNLSFASSATPPFNSATDLTIPAGTTTLVESGATPITGITTDLLGTTRATGSTFPPTAANTNPDMGAYEGSYAIPSPLVVSTLTYTQNSANTAPNATNQQVTGVDVKVSGLSGSLTLNSITFNLGSTNTADITNARLYSTGSSGTFTTTTLVATTGSIAATYTLTLTTPASLAVGDNYFFLTYDITSTAPNVAGGSVASTPTAVNVGGTSYTSATSPAITRSGAAGTRTILSSMNGDYTVGTALGTEPYATITAALSDVNIRGIKTAANGGAGVRLLLTNPGATKPYNTANGETMPLTIGTVPGASAATPLTIKPYTGTSPLISGNTSSGTLALTVGATYVILDGSNTTGGTTQDLTIENTTTTATNTYVVGINPSAATTATTSNNTISNTVLRGTSTTTPAYGLVVNTSGSNTINNNTLYLLGTGIELTGTSLASQDGNNAITGNTIGQATPSSNGFGVNGIQALNETNLTITGNTIQNANTAVDNIGIDLYSNITTALVRSNTIKDLLTSTSTSTSAVHAGIRVGSFTTSTVAGVTGVTVDANTITDIQTSNTGGYGVYGIFVNTGNGAATNSNIVLSNNMLSNLDGASNYNAFASSSTAGIYLLSTQNGISILHNSVYLTGTYSYSFVTTITACLVVSNNSTVVTVANNIFYNSLVNSGTTGKPYSFYSGAAKTAYTAITNNDYYSAGSQASTSYLVYLGSAQTTQAGVTTATGDNNPYSVDPVFNSTTDLHLKNSSPLDNSGSTAYLGTVPKDFDLQLRPGASGYTGTGTAPDIGADEFTPSPIDVKPTALTAPLATACYTNNEAVTITLQNVGTGTQDFSVNPVSVSVVVTLPGGGTTTVTGTLSTGTLAVGSTVSFSTTAGGNGTTAGNINMTTAGTYSFAITAISNGVTETLTPSPTRTTGTPTAGNITPAMPTAFCQSGSLTLTLSSATNGTIQWEQSTTSATTGFAAVTGGTGATTLAYTTPTLTQTTYYRAGISCNGTTVYSSNVVTVTVNNPVATGSASPSSFCGSGTSTITGNGPTNTTVRIYDAMTGGSLLATGTANAGTVTYTTPTLSNSSAAPVTYNYYAAASTGTTLSVGKTTTDGIDGGNTGGYGLYFTTTAAVAISTVTVYLPASASAGSITVELRAGSSLTGTVVATQTFALPANTSTSIQSMVLNLTNFNVPAAGSYTLDLASGSYTLIRDASGDAATTPSYPYTSADGVVSITGNSNSSSYYYYFYNWSIISACEGARTAVPVTVNPATALTPASTTQTVCAGASTTITFSGYPTLSVSPTAGTSISGQNITFTPPATGTTVYTVTGTDGTCSNQATVSLASNPLATGTASASPSYYCGASSGTPALNLTGTTGQTSFVWQSSTTSSGPFTTITGSDNMNPYTAPTITATTYYQAVATCGTNTASSNVVTVPLSNPTITGTNSGVTRCGAGPVTLMATSSSNSTPYYYAAATGGQSLGSGASYVATVAATPATQTFYVAPRDMSTTTYVAGLADNGYNAGTGTYAYGTYAASPTTQDRAIGFNVTQVGTLVSVDVYPSAAGTAVITVYAATANPGATGAALANINATFTAAQVGTKVTVPLGVALSAGSYKISSATTSPTFSRYSGAFTGTYPYTNGPLSVLGSYNSSTTSVFVNTTYNSYFNVTFTGSCEQATRTPITVNVGTAPALTPATSSATICSGGSTSITYAGYNFLSVSPTTGVTVSGLTVTYNPTTTTTYTVTGTQSSDPSDCINTATASITVNPAPNAPTLTPANASICAGNSTTVMAVSTGTSTVPATALSATFDSGANGFTVTSTGAAATKFTLATPPYTKSGTVGGPSSYVGPSANSTQFYVSTSAASTAAMTSALVSPAFSTVGYTAATLTLRQYYGYYSSGSETAAVQYSLNGTTWMTLVNYTSAAQSQGNNNGSAEALTSITLPPAALNQASIQIRFYYASTYGLFWAIDDVTVSGSKLETPTYAVSPSTGASVSASTITFNPTTTTTYNVTASYPSNGCSSPATPITITVNTSTTWTGGTSSDWFTAGNWTNCVPNALTDATIPSGVTTMPVINSATAAATKNLTIAGSSTLMLTGASSVLNINGDFTTASATSFIATAGIVNFLGSSAQAIGAGTYYNLALSGSGSTAKTLSSDVVVSQNLDLSSGMLDSNGHEVQVGNAITGASSAHYVITNGSTGRLRFASVASSASVTFPIGTTDYTPASLTNSGSAASFAASVKASLDNPATMNGHYVNEQWDISGPASGANVALTLQWNAADEGTAFDRTHAAVAHYQNSAWNTACTTCFGGASGANPYTLTRSGITSFSPFGVEDNTKPLPVELSRFAATRQGSDAELSWATASEKDNAGFAVQVATDGKTFRELHFIEPASTNSSTPRSYTYTDREDEKSGLRYYRLRQVNLDGTMAFSPVRSLDFGQSSEILLSAVPNPFSNQLTLQMVVPTAVANALLTITDATGRTVQQQALSLAAGASQVTLSKLDALPSGIYLLRLDMRGQFKSLKVVRE